MLRGKVININRIRNVIKKLFYKDKERSEMKNAFNGLGENTILFLTKLCSREGNGNPFLYSCLENPMDGGAWWAAVHGVAKSRT